MLKNKRKNGTFIHGIASSEHIDSSGERIKIEGVDITSLTRDGVLNLEHQSKEASSIVGKIWEAKKILKREDCENDHHRYFWDKVKMPYIYIAGELFDSVGHQQASEIAAMLKFDQQESLNKESRKLINFSIEGSRVEKTGQVITKCIARKVSITLVPCNKVCEAEELVIDDSAKKESASGDFTFIQDIMSKADEASCQVMKGEIPFLYKNEEVEKSKKTPIVMTAKEAVDEHEHLVAVLDSPSHQDDKKEAKKQRQELKEYKEKLDKGEKNINPKDPVLNYDKKSPKPVSEEKQKEYAAKVSSLQSKTSKAENPCWDGYKKVPGKKNYEEGSCVKKKLSKYDSNVRKALTASCGMGSPSAKVQGEAVSKNMKTPILSSSEFIYKNEDIGSVSKPSQGTKIGQTRSGKDIFSHAKVGEYQGFSPQDHVDAAEFHRQMVLSSPSFKDKEMHMQKIRLHNQAFSSGRNKQIRSEAIAKVPGAKALPPQPSVNTAPQGRMGFSAQASNYSQSEAPVSPVQTSNATNPNMKMAKNEVFVVRKLGESDVNKGSKNVREQRKKVFGTKSQPSAGSAMREKHIAHIKQFIDKHLGLDLQPSGGKVNDKTGQRRNAENEEGVDKPDWRSGKFEAQWNPEAIVHEIAHLMLLPKGVGLEEGQRLMDKQYSDVQKQYGYMKQKRSQHEVQPMAAEQLIRRAMGLPASTVSIPVKSKNDPHRMSLEDPTKPIATRIQSGKEKDGTPKYVDLIRQARNLHPEHKQRLMDIFSGKIKFHPDHGWQPNKASLDAAITNRAPGAVMARQNKKQMAAPQPTELPPNVVRMKQPAPAAPAPAPAMPAQPAAEAPQQPPMKIAKSEQRMVMKMLGDQAFENFEKKEDLLAFLAEKLPRLSDRERLAIAKAVAYTSEKKKEAALASLMDEE